MQDTWIQTYTGKAFYPFNSFEHYANKAKGWWSNGAKLICPDGHVPKHGNPDGKSYPMYLMHRVGKGEAGAVLDGREWREVANA